MRIVPVLNKNHLEENPMPTTMREIRNPGAAQWDPAFPQAPEDWSRETAREIAHREGISLEAVHWEVIGVLQAYFSQQERPNIRQLHDALEERFHARGGMKYLYKVFPKGPVAQGCRLAGLKPPAGTVDRSFGSVQ